MLHIAAIDEGFHSISDAGLWEYYKECQSTAQKPGKSKLPKVPTMIKKYMTQFENLKAVDPQLTSKPDYIRIIKTMTRKVLNSNLTISLYDIALQIADITKEPIYIIHDALMKQTDSYSKTKAKNAYSASMRPMRHLVYDKKENISQSEIDYIVTTYKADVFPKMQAFKAAS